MPRIPSKDGRVPFSGGRKRKRCTRLDTYRNSSIRARDSPRHRRRPVDRRKERRKERRQERTADPPFTDMLCYNYHLDTALGDLTTRHKSSRQLINGLTVSLGPPSHSDLVFHFSPVIAKVTDREAKWTRGSQLDSYRLVFYTPGIPGSILYPCSASCFVPWSYSVVFRLRV